MIQRGLVVSVKVMGSKNCVRSLHQPIYLVFFVFVLLTQRKDVRGDGCVDINGTL